MVFLENIEPNNTSVDNFREWHKMAPLYEYFTLLHQKQLCNSGLQTFIVAVAANDDKRSSRTIEVVIVESIRKVSKTILVNFKGKLN